MTRLRLLSLLVPAMAMTVLAEPDPGPFSKIAVIHVREDPDQAIDPSFKRSVLRRLEQITEWGADCIVLDIESYGGLVSSSIETADEIFAISRKHPGRPESDVHTIAYVGRKAISGAAMLSLACQEIVLTETGRIGDSQVIYFDASGNLQVAPEKMQTTVASTFRQYAQGNGIPVPLAEAMVRQEMEVTRFRKPIDPRDPSKGHTWVYYRTDTLGGGPSRLEIEEQRLSDPEVVVNADELATFSAQDALEHGIASRLEPDLESLLKSISGPDTEMLHLEWNWAEKTSRWLLGMRIWLFLIGVGALYFALKTPGTGVPEALALLCFGLFFGASAVANLAGALEVILFLIGLLLIAVEIFILPGFGVAGFLGLAAIIASVALAAIPEGTQLPSAAAPGFFLLPMARDFLIGSIGAILLVFILVRNLPKVPFLRRLHLESAASQTGSAVGGMDYAGRTHPLVGSKGVAETALRPSGRALIGGERKDVVAEGAFLSPGTAVRVVQVRGNVIIVRAESQA
jgi:membrane-bound serine protease (ClpP class)